MPGVCCKVSPRGSEQGESPDHRVRSGPPRTHTREYPGLSPALEILPQRSSLNDLISAVIEEQRARFESFEVKLEIFLTRDLSLIPLDTELFKKAMEAIMDALLDLCQPGSALEVRTQPGDQGVQLLMVVKGVQVSEDDIEHFFYPFTTQPERPKTLDLPLAKMIIHKHKGLVNLRPKDSTRVDLNISLPQ